MTINFLTVEDIEEFNKLFTRLQEITPQLERIARDYDNYYLLIKQYAETFIKHEDQLNENIGTFIFEMRKTTDKMIRLLDKRMNEQKQEQEKK